LLLSNTAERILDTFDQMPYAFTTVTSVGFLDLDGSGANKLMIGADFSGVGSSGIDTAVFDVSHRKLRPLISFTTLVLYEADPDQLDIHTLELDEHQTRLAKGNRFFFVKTTYAEKATVFPKPVITHVSYPVGTGIPLNWQ
jgi:hypothetical protein